VEPVEIWLKRVREIQAFAGAALGMVGAPRHFLVYRLRGSDVAHVLRVLRDARDVERGLPAD